VREREETTKKNSSRSHSLTLTLSPFAPFWVCIVSDMLRTQPSSNITDYIGGKNTNKFCNHTRPHNTKRPNEKNS
jgi:hypothetical protein